MMESDLVFTGESANALELIWNSFIKSSVDLMDLAASGTVAGLVVAAVVETGAGCVHRLPDHDGTVHLHDCQFLHLRVDPGWQD